MPRRNNNRKSGNPSPVGFSGPRVEAGPAGNDGESYLVRQIPGARAVKTYRCPGCDHEIRPGVAHLVAWPADGPSGADERRHWHTGCWNGRGSRGLTRRWS